MSRLLIIAGPQAAGKSTVVNYLSSQLDTMAPLFPSNRGPLIFRLQESRQIIVHKNLPLGAIFMTPEDEEEVVHCDLQRMDRILKRNDKDLLYLDECNIFTLAHARAHGIIAIERYWDTYMERLKQLRASVIFINIHPDISWERRQRVYEKRLVYFPDDQHSEIMERYHLYLAEVHPLLMGIYKGLPLPKAMIDGRSSEENVIKEVCQQMVTLGITP